MGAQFSCPVCCGNQDLFGLECKHLICITCSGESQRTACHCTSESRKTKETIKIIEDLKGILVCNAHSEYSDKEFLEIYCKECLSSPLKIAHLYKLLKKYFPSMHPVLQFIYSRINLKNTEAKLFFLTMFIKNQANNCIKCSNLLDETNKLKKICSICLIFFQSIDNMSKIINDNNCSWIPPNYKLDTWKDIAIQYWIYEIISYFSNIFPIGPYFFCPYCKISFDYYKNVPYTYKCRYKNKHLICYTCAKSGKKKCKFDNKSIKDLIQYLPIKNCVFFSSCNNIGAYFLKCNHFICDKCLSFNILTDNKYICCNITTTINFNEDQHNLFVFCNKHDIIADYFNEELFITICEQCSYNYNSYKISINYSKFACCLKDKFKKYQQNINRDENSFFSLTLFKQYHILKEIISNENYNIFFKQILPFSYKDFSRGWEIENSKENCIKFTLFKDAVLTGIFVGGKLSKDELIGRVKILVNSTKVASRPKYYRFNAEKINKIVIQPFIKMKNADFVAIKLRFSCKDVVYCYSGTALINISSYSHIEFNLDNEESLKECGIILGLDFL